MIESHTRPLSPIDFFLYIQMTQYLNGTSIVKLYNKSNDADYIVTYIDNSQNKESKYGLTARLLQVNTMKNKKITSTKKITSKIFLNINSSVMHKEVFSQPFTKIAIECLQSIHNDKPYNKMSYHKVTQEEIDRFELDDNMLDEQLETSEAFEDEFMF